MDHKLPLFIVTGASGTGKTTVMQELPALMPDFVVFSTDDDIFGTTGPKLEYQDRYNILLNFASFVAKSGRGTIICGTMMPWDIENGDRYSFFSDICFINLHCDDATRNHRLRNRGDQAMWSDDMLRQHEQFAQWLLDNAESAYHPPMPTINTSNMSPYEVAEQIKHYVMLNWLEASETST